MHVLIAQPFDVSIFSTQIYVFPMKSFVKQATTMLYYTQRRICTPLNMGVGANERTYKSKFLDCASLDVQSNILHASDYLFA